MFVDQQTLRDLEIFEGRDRRPSIFNFLDHARTAGGAKKLRGRLRAPFSNADQIRSVQKALRAIIAHREQFRKLPGQYVMSAFEHYFHWRLTPPAAGRGFGLLIDGMQIWIGDYRHYAQIMTGVRHTVHLLRSLEQLVTTQPWDDAGDLSDYAVEIRRLLHDVELSKLPAKPPEKWYWWVLLRADQMFRKDYSDAIKKIAELYCEIDALIAMADATVKNGFELPEVVEGATVLEADGIIYPLVRKAIENPVALGGEQRLLFITGPNMAGKTTYLRACGLALYLAHVGMSVPAKRFRFSPCDALFTALSLLDDVRAGISFFKAEALRAQAIARAIAEGGRVIALVDEPFKGTNVRDAFDASRQFLTRLSKCERSMFLVASHLVELGVPLEESGFVTCCFFAANENGGRELEFDYRLHPGVSEQRLGVRVLEEHDVFTLLDAPRRNSASAHVSS